MEAEAEAAREGRGEQHEEWLWEQGRGGAGERAQGRHDDGGGGGGCHRHYSLQLAAGGVEVGRWRRGSVRGEARSRSASLSRSGREEGFVGREGEELGLDTMTCGTELGSVVGVGRGSIRHIIDLGEFYSI